MTEKAQDPPIKVPNARRKKLWEIDSQYHCSIVGTCLTMGDLRRVIRKCKIEIPNDTLEYHIHGSFVGFCHKRCLPTRQLQKRLERKHRLAVRRFARAKTSRELVSLWAESLAEGDIPGPYWALLSHPAVTDEIMGQAFGEVHMLSHLMGAGNRADIRALRRLEERSEALEESLAATKANAGRRLRQRDDRIRELEADRASGAELSRKLDEAQRTIASLSSAPDTAELRAENETLQRKMESLAAHAARMSERHQGASERARRYEERIHELEVRLEKRRLEQEALEADLETMLLSGGACTCRERSTCPEPGLCGRSILYVGGRSRLVQHYRALVQRHGGDFIHHDGGHQDGRGRLPELLSRADVVLCPVDCVSHDACLRLKQHCKRLAKHCVFMRSSGLSTLVKEIQLLAA